MEPKKKKNSNRIVVIKLIGIIIYSAINIYLFYFLITLGFNPAIISILLLFIILVTIGFFLRSRKRKLYSRMFPQKKYVQIRKEQIKNQKDQNQEIKIPKAVNLELEYRKPLIDKCKYCGNIVPNFVKKCPFCNENINQ
ncbi:MAG: hypothetical protein JSV23_03050 [Promethearchaeota archaeon]|nr:MAG: hypothetical protein JSV23_03050 [Candidatus Lokiarchaeota archaeon]